MFPSISPARGGGGGGAAKSETRKDNKTQNKKDVKAVVVPRGRMAHDSDSDSDADDIVRVKKPAGASAREAKAEKKRAASLSTDSDSGNEKPGRGDEKNDSADNSDAEVERDDQTDLSEEEKSDQDNVMGDWQVQIEEWLYVRGAMKFCDKMDTPGNHDPYMAVYLYDHMWKKLSSFPLERKAENPNVDTSLCMILLLEELCKNDPKKPFQLKFFAQKKRGKPVLQGEIEMTVDELNQRARDRSPIEVYQHNTRSKCGTLTLLSSEMVYNTTQGVINTKTPALFSSKTECMVRIHIIGKDLDKMDYFGKSDPYLEFYKLDGSQWTSVYRTEVQHNTLEPDYHPFVLSVSQFCDTDFNRPLQIKCWDWNSSGSPSFIGQFQTNLRNLLNNKDKKGKPIKWGIVHPDKKAKNKHYAHSGTFIMKSAYMFTTQRDLDFHGQLDSAGVESSSGTSSPAKGTRSAGEVVKAQRARFLDMLNEGKALTQAQSSANASREVSRNGVEDRGAVKLDKLEKKRAKGSLQLICHGRGLTKKDRFSKSDPFLQIFRFDKRSAKWIAIARTDPIMNTLDPDFPALSFKVSEAIRDSSQGLKTKLLFRVSDWNETESSELIGEFTMTVNEIFSAMGKEAELISSKEKQTVGSSYKNSGILRFYTVKFIKKKKDGSRK